MLTQVHYAVRKTKYLLAALLTAPLLSGCVHFRVDDCPGGVLGNNDAGSARVRTANYRVMLADPPAAASRFLPYAIMSTYAYKIGDGCVDGGNKNRVSGERAATLREWLDSSNAGSSKWQLEPAVGMREAQIPHRIGCEDDLGLMFHVWHRKVEGRDHVVIAFRGTSGAGDFWNANFWWFRRAFTDDTQFDRARGHARAVIQFFDQKAVREGAPAPRYTTTGHSLGGSLAQHILYAFPKQIEQAIVFDTSSVTGFSDSSISRENRISGCSCRPELGPEARIIRVYQTYEILANLRIFHKIFFPPERHVQEVRFPFDSSWNPVTRHSIGEFTESLQAAARRRRSDEIGHTWLASADPTCTRLLLEKQSASCALQVSPSSLQLCPSVQ